jgi:hypothetical protein
MSHQTPSSLPIGYFVVGVSVFVVIFTNGLLQALAATGVAAIVGFFAYGGLARTRAAAQSLARYFGGH